MRVTTLVEGLDALVATLGSIQFSRVCEMSEVSELANVSEGRGRKSGERLEVVRLKMIGYRIDERVCE